MLRMKRFWNEWTRTGNYSRWWRLANWSTSVTYHATPH